MIDLKTLSDRIDVLELATMWTSGFPEPRTFSLRAARLLAARLDERRHRVYAD